MTSPQRPAENPNHAGLKTLRNTAASHRGLGQSTIMSVMRQTPIGPISPLLVGAVAMVLVGVTLYVGWLVRERLRDGIRESLETVLAANVSALELWLGEQRELVERLVRDPQTHAAVLTAVNESRRVGQSGADNTAAAETHALSDEDTEQLLKANYLGWVATDPLGVIVDSNRIHLIGQRLPLSRHLLNHLQSGRAAVSHPLHFEASNDGSRVLGPSDTSQGQSSSLPHRPPQQAVMCAIAPIKEGRARYVGCLAVLIDPSQQFTEILQVARMGATGETYALDRDAVMLSSSRFENQLHRIGLLAENRPSPLNVQARDPGRDLRQSELHQSDLPEQSSARWPMTLMADEVTRGGQGSNVIGFNDYRGVPVVGAWVWLSRYEMGVATKQDVAEALRPIFILRTAFWALLGLVLLTVAILLAFAWVTRPTRRNQDRVAELSRRLGQYDLRQRIGRGGMGTVFLGAHGLLDRVVAIKVLENADATERSLHRFQREVQLTARLNHPNTIEIYDFGRTEEGTFFYVMEYVDGISLEQLVDHYGRQPTERVIYLLLQICGSIAEAHQAGMVHRDIKPANVLLTSRSGIHDLVKVLDFGLAKQIDHDSIQLTRVDSLTGTPMYMSPESIRDASAAGVLSDIYSIGAVGYTLLTGVTPFSGETSADICAQKLHEDPLRPQLRIDAPLPQDIQRVLMDCLSCDPEKRPQSVEDLATRLSMCQDGPKWTQRDAALWWDQVFDGPYLEDYELEPESEGLPKEGTKGDTAVNEKRPVA